MHIDKPAYNLLIDYMKESRILSKAYKYSENYYRLVNKILTYPVIIFSSVGTVVASMATPHKYTLLGCTLATLIFTGFKTIINPQYRQYKSTGFSREFDEISSNINQFVQENNKSPEDIKIYSKLILEVLHSWKSTAPDLKESYMKRAKAECSQKLRRSLYIPTSRSKKLNEIKIEI